MQEQLSIYDIEYEKFKIDKPIRLIELFSGYGSQALALKYLGVNFEYWKTCEWAIKSIQAYKDIHFEYDETYPPILESQTKEEMVDYLFKKGISSNYNEPMTKQQIQKLDEKQLRNILNNIYQTHNLVNIQQVKGEDLEIIDTDKYCYIMTYSFPCQDLSLAGKGKGMGDTTTRSGMLWEVERILTETPNKPQVLLMENVPQVHSQDNLKDFNKWKDRLEELGYKNYFQDLIATDYGIPQTRNRCFMVSLLGDYSYTFPKPIPLKLRLKDMLEDNADEKYYLSDKIQNKILSVYEDGNGVGIDLCDSKSKNRELCSTIKSRYDCGFEHFSPGPTGIIDKKYYLSNKMIDYITSKDDKYKVNENKLVINRDIACSKTTREGSTRADTSDYICRDLPGNTNLLKIKNATAMGGENNGVVVLGNYSPSNHEASRIIDSDYAAPTIKENHGTINAIVDKQNNSGVCVYDFDSSEKFLKNGSRDLGEQENFPTLLAKGQKYGIYKTDLRIRKLTPRECFRLQGVKDEDYNNVCKNQSDSSLYHLAGDSIVVNVLMAVFGEML